MSLISPNVDVKSIIFPNLAWGLFPKIAGKKPCALDLLSLMDSSFWFEINLGWSIKCIEGSQIILFQNKI